MVRPMRGREANPDGELVGVDLYELLGDTEGALDSLSTRNKKGAKAPDEYNRLVLSHLVSHSHSGSSSSAQTGGGDLAKKLTEWENHQNPINKEARVAPSARKRKRNEWIMTYNRALALHAAGDSIGSIELCLEKLKPLILEDQRVSDELLNVSCRMAFLFLEGIITTSVCCHLGIEQVDNRVTSDMVVDWMDRLDLDEDPQLKFLLALYRSRLDFQQKDSAGRLVDAKIRSARKELKQAMEIFQHKLRPSAGDSSSVDSASYSEEQTQVSASHSQQQIPWSRILQRQNQAALNLKANTEQLKGNIKKSLILCGEAQAAVAENENSSYAMIHTTNLANIYETNGRRHLALHTIAKALRSNPPASTFEIDGTANPDPTMAILHNAALCALQAHNFIAAYECMVNCVRCSSVMGRRPRCWLRLAEACIGMHSKRRQEIIGNKFAKVETAGESATKGILLQNDLLLEMHDEFVANDDPDRFRATPKDLEVVQNFPLSRAREALDTALGFFEQATEKDKLGIAAAQLAMSYVCLEYRDFQKALEYAKRLLDDTGSNQSKGGIDIVSRNMLQRQKATARMYAAEASCALGESIESMRFLVGDGKDDAFDRLASELGGVTLETAATNAQGKARLARAQAMVRCSASAASASMGNLAAAKQLAISSQAMEDAYSASRGRSFARRALVYCLLREGNCGAALSVLRSAR